MTEQSINPALWRAVADELERIAGAEWPASAPLQHMVWHAVREMPDCEQRDGILRAQGHGVPRAGAAAIRGHRYLLRALAGALRAEADKAEGQRGDCPHCNAALWPFETACGFCGGTRE